MTTQLAMTMKDRCDRCTCKEPGRLELLQAAVIDGISTTVTLRTPGRPDITTTPEQLKKALDTVKGRKGSKGGRR